MSKKRFSNEEIELLYQNKYVQNVSEKGITYTNEFKIHFIAEDSKRKTARIIFEEARFDVDILGNKRIESAGGRWRAAYKINGISTRRCNSGRSRK